MITPLSRRLIATFAVVTSTSLAFGGCGAGSNEVAEEDVEREVAQQLAAEVDQPEPNIDCPSALPAEVDATIECVLTVDGDDTAYPVTVTVTSVNDDDVDFDAEVGTEPIGGGSESGDSSESDTSESSDTTDTTDTSESSDTTTP